MILHLCDSSAATLFPIARACSTGAIHQVVFYLKVFFVIFFVGFFVSVFILLTEIEHRRKKIK